MCVLFKMVTLHSWHTVFMHELLTIGEFASCKFEFVQWWLPVISHPSHFTPVT